MVATPYSVGQAVTTIDLLGKPVIVHVGSDEAVITAVRTLQEYLPGVRTIGLSSVEELNTLMLSNVAIFLVGHGGYDGLGTLEEVVIPWTQLNFLQHRYLSTRLYVVACDAQIFLQQWDVTTARVSFAPRGKIDSEIGALQALIQFARDHNLNQMVLLLGFHLLLTLGKPLESYQFLAGIGVLYTDISVRTKKVWFVDVPVGLDIALRADIDRFILYLVSIIEMVGIGIPLSLLFKETLSSGTLVQLITNTLVSFLYLPSSPYVRATLDLLTSTFIPLLLDLIIPAVDKASTAMIGFFHTNKGPIMTKIAALGFTASLITAVLGPLIIEMLNMLWNYAIKLAIQIADFIISASINFRTKEWQMRGLTDWFNWLLYGVADTLAVNFALYFVGNQALGASIGLLVRDFVQLLADAYYGINWNIVIYQGYIGF